MKHLKSKEYFTQAKRVIPGGVNSPVRAFKSVGCDPLFIARAEGSRIYRRRWQQLTSTMSVPGGR